MADKKPSGILPIPHYLPGIMLTAITAMVILDEWNGSPAFGHLAAGATAVLLAVLSTQVRWTRNIFVIVGLVLSAGAFATRQDWTGLLETALGKAAFIAAFFTALTSLRHAADTSPAIQICGRFLAGQPPGRRYAALTVGGQVFAILLNYGAIALLGSLATASARSEPNAEIRAHRTRRMLLAIQRGFVSTLPWSPLAFAMAITTSLIAKSSWANALIPCLVSGAILAGTGWVMDTIFKPRLSTAVPVQAKPEGTWASVIPLLVLLAILVVCVSVLHLATGIRAVGVVIVVVPLIAVVWTGIQARGSRPFATIGRSAASYLGRDLPAYRGELVLLMMAGFIGTLAGILLAPLLVRSGLNLEAIPALAILVALVWVIPLSGQIGMNPILTVSMIAPILPAAASIGVSPTDIVVAITAGWALSGASSPYTATTLLIGSFGGVSAAHVGVIWNGAYTLLCGVLLSAWMAFVALT